MKKIIKHLKENWIRHGFETLVITAGILLAFSLNNWNENRIVQNRITSQLEALVKSLEVQKEQLDFIRITHMFRYNSLQYILGMADVTLYVIPDGLEEVAFEISWFWKAPIPKEQNRKFIDLSFSWSGRYAITSPNTSIADELDRSGAYAQIKNFELKEAIDHFYNELKWRLTDQTDRSLEKWNDSLIEDGVYYINTADLDDPIALLKGNRKRLALLRTIVGEAHWFSISAKGLLLEADNLVLLIEEELHH